MPDLFPFQADTVQAFLLVLTRVAATLGFLPVTGGKAAPKTVKAGLAALVSAVLFPFIDTSSISTDIDVFSLSLKIAGEVMVGLASAFFVNLILATVQLAGSIIGFQVGFGIVNVVDPVTNLQVSLTSQFFNIFAVLLFLAFNIHHVLLRALADSFNSVPLGGFAAQAGLFDVFMGATSALWVVGSHLAAPLTVMLLLKQVAMGLIARTVPQMNIMIVGLPLTIAFGLITIGYSLPTMSVVVEKLFSRMVSQIGLAYSLMG